MVRHGRRIAHRPRRLSILTRPDFLRDRNSLADQHGSGGFDQKVRPVDAPRFLLALDPNFHGINHLIRAPSPDELHTFSALIRHLATVKHPNSQNVKIVLAFGGLRCKTPFKYLRHMSRPKRKKPMKANVTRNGKLLGGFVPLPIINAIQTWIKQEPERDLSTFVRQAAREKLQRDGIPFDERQMEAAR